MTEKAELMKGKYDAETDALNVRFSDGAVGDTEEMRPGIMIDLDDDGRIIAIELLDASEHLAPGADLKALIAA